MMRLVVPCAAVLLAIKLLMLRGTRLRPWRLVGYLLLWPGTDPRPFEESRACPGAWRLAAWGGVKLLLGLAAVVLAARLGEPWLLVGGLLLAIHGGLCDVLGGLWRAAGVPVGRLFENPAASSSLAEFWGRRWNAAFHHFTRVLIYRSLAPRVGRPAAVAAVFLLSGLLHEMAISYPAGGGWGLPMIYFAAHGALTAAGLRGRIATLTAVILPLPLLFHEPFREMILAWIA